MFLFLCALVVFSSLNIVLSTDLIGAYVLLPFDDVPHGYLECNGQAVSVYDYPELFAVIRDRYGGNNIAQTFNVPDMRGLVPRGTDRSGTVDSEVRTTGDIQQDAMQPITGEMGSIRVRLNMNTFTSGAFTHETGAYSGDSNNGGINTINFRLDSSLVTRTANETRVKNMAAMFVIRVLPPSTMLNVTQLCDARGNNCTQPSDIAMLSSEVLVLNATAADQSNNIIMLGREVSDQSNDIAMLSSEVLVLNATAADQSNNIIMLGREVSDQSNDIAMLTGQLSAMIARLDSIEDCNCDNDDVIPLTSPWSVVILSVLCNCMVTLLFYICCCRNRRRESDSNSEQSNEDIQSNSVENGTADDPLKLAITEY